MHRVIENRGTVGVQLVSKWDSKYSFKGKRWPLLDRKERKERTTILRKKYI